MTDMRDQFPVPGPEHLRGWRMRDYDDLIATLGRSRESQGVSMRQLTRRSGVGIGTISEALRGEIDTAASKVFALIDALGYDLALIPRDAEPARTAPERCTDPACPNAAIDNHAHLAQADADELLRQIVAAMVEDFPAEDQVSASISTLAAETVPLVDQGTVGPENGTGGEWGDYPLSETYPGSGIYE